MRQFLAWLWAGLALTLGGGTGFLICLRPTSYETQNIGWMLVLFLLGVFILLLCPFSSLAMPINKGYAGEMSFSFLRIGQGEYRFQLSARKDGEELSLEGQLTLLKAHRRYAELKGESKEVFYLPYKALKEEDVAYLKRVAEEIENAQKARKARRKNRVKPYIYQGREQKEKGSLGLSFWPSIKAFREITRQSQKRASSQCGKVQYT